MKLYIQSDPLFYNKDGTLNRYALACGYVEKKENGNNRKTMYMEHGTFHVIHVKDGKRESWESFDSDDLTNARKHYKKIKV